MKHAMIFGTSVFGFAYAVTGKSRASKTTNSDFPPLLNDANVVKMHANQTLETEYV